MKTKILLSTVALVAGLAIFARVERKPSSSSAPDNGRHSTSPATSARMPKRVHAVDVVQTRASSELAAVSFEGEYDLASVGSFDARLEAARGFQMPSLLVELERMPDSPVKDERMRSTLTKWAVTDGAAAVTWASQHLECRQFLPDTLQAWAGGGADAAASAWTFAKTAFATDPDEAAWRSPMFVTAAFRGMAATPGEAVWTELATLSGASAIHAMLGVGDFASNLQINTDFAAYVESKTLGLGSVPLSAAFYAAAGHIQAAKDDLASVADAAQWHPIAQEIARQQAVFEPSKAIDWLASQFSQPADGIEDVVESVGMMHALNAGDVLNWLNAFPVSEERTTAIQRILQKFPELRTDLAVEVITEVSP